MRKTVPEAVDLVYSQVKRVTFFSAFANVFGIKTRW